MLGTGSMDWSAKLWDIETGSILLNFSGHKGEVISINFTNEGDRIITGSFDGTARVWDAKSGKCITCF